MTRATEVELIGGPFDGQTVAVVDPGPVYRVPVFAPDHPFLDGVSPAGPGEAVYLLGALPGRYYHDADDGRRLRDRFERSAEWVAIFHRDTACTRSLDVVVPGVDGAVRWSKLAAGDILTLFGDSAAIRKALLAVFGQPCLCGCGTYEYVDVRRGPAG